MPSPKTVLLTKRGHLPNGYRAGGYSRGVMLIHLAFDTALRRRLPGVPERLKLTAGSNGRHSAGGPHYAPRFEAADLESKPIRGSRVDSAQHAHLTAGDNKRVFLVVVMSTLEPVLLIKENHTKVFTRNYFGWLEAEGTTREHFHVQVRKGRTIRLPPSDCRLR